MGEVQCVTSPLSFPSIPSPPLLQDMKAAGEKVKKKQKEEWDREEKERRLERLKEKVSCVCVCVYLAITVVGEVATCNSCCVAVVALFSKY